MSCLKCIETFCNSCCLGKDKDEQTEETSHVAANKSTEGTDPYVVVNVVPLEILPEHGHTTAVSDQDATLPVPKHIRRPALRARKKLARTASLDLKHVSGALRPSLTIGGQQLSTLQFSLYFDFQSSILTVNLLRGTNLAILPRPKEGSKRRVFVVLHLHPSKEQIFESKLVPSTPNPSFYQAFEFKLRNEEARRESVVFRLYEGSGGSRSNFIGSVVVSLKKSDIFGTITAMIVDESGKNLPVSVVNTSWPLCNNFN